MSGYPYDFSGRASFLSRLGEDPSFLRDQERLQELQLEQAGLLESASKKPKVTGTDALIASLASAIPALAGYAMAGSDGLATGLAASSEGVGSAFEGLRNYGAEEREAAAAKYKANEPILTELRKNLLAQETAARKGDMTVEQNQFRDDAAGERTRLNIESREKEGSLNRAQALELAERRLAAGNKGDRPLTPEEEAADRKVLMNIAENKKLTDGMTEDEILVAFRKDGTINRAISAGNYQQALAREDRAVRGEERRAEDTERKISNTTADQATRLLDRVAKDPLREPIVQAEAAARQVRTYIQSDNKWAQGALSNTLIRGIAGDKGVASDKDIQRAMPDSLKQFVLKMKQYSTGSQDMPLSAADKKSLIELAGIIESVAATNRSKMLAQYQEIGKDIAPNLSEESRHRVVNNGISSAGIDFSTLSEVSAPAKTSSVHSSFEVGARIKNPYEPGKFLIVTESGYRDAD